MIKTVKALIVAGLTAVAVSGPVLAKDNGYTAALGPSGQIAGKDQDVLAMPVFDETRPPIGHIQFCQRYRDECRGGTSAPRRAELTADRWAELNAINAQINGAVAPVTDMDLYGAVEFWTYPHAAGDCEDYVLLKRRTLAERGWPIESLLITVVADENGDGHAVLSVATDHGDFILDNKNQSVLLWSETPYEFKKRQSMNHPYVWVSLAPATGWLDNLLLASPR